VSRADDELAEVASLRSRATQAALDELRGGATLEGVDGAARRAAILQYEGYANAQAVLARVRTPEDRDDDLAMAEELARALRRATDVERALVLAERRQGRVSPASADEVLRDIEGRAVRGF
jgi:hypothetical protein